MKTISENCSENYFCCCKLFMLLKTILKTNYAAENVLKTIYAAENCFSGG